MKKNGGIDFRKICFKIFWWSF